MKTRSDVPTEQLAAAARATIAAHERGDSGCGELQRICPNVCEQVRADAAQLELMQLWGRSLNFDEHAKQAIVDPAVLDCLGKLAGVGLRGQIVHAGLQHTYGYLFSLIETPYGFKRDRWVEPTIDAGFGFEQPTIRAFPVAGTLLGNLTYFLGRAVWPGHGRLETILERNPNTRSRDVADYDYSRLRLQRIEERIQPPTRARRVRQVLLATDLLAFPRATSLGDRAPTALLVYWAMTGPRSQPRLITCFPMFPEAAKELTAPERMGNDVEIATRYNAYLSGVTGKRVRGQRTLQGDGPS